MRKQSRVGRMLVIAMISAGAPGLARADDFSAQRRAWGDVAAAIARGQAIQITPEVRSRLDEIDSRAHQRDALWSGLSWHTNLTDALEEAARSNRPVLSLRMLGRLDEEYSCANSRFFRAALYANAEVSAYLRDHFVLHWQSVRPVPRITIDYGDGRVIESTITGNSIHYVLSPEGEVVDALPGLYGPGVFLEALREAVAHAHERDSEAPADLPVPHIEPGPAAPSASYEPVAVNFAEAAAASFNDGRFEQVPQDLAQRAMMTTFSKMFIEMPALDALLGLEVHPVKVEIPLSSAGYVDRCRLDAPSISLIRTQMGDADEAEISRTIASFEMSMAADTALNEEMIRPMILAMLEGDPSLRHDLERLNERVYAEVFMTPSDDAWLGLRAEHAYTGLWSRHEARQGR